MQVLKKHKITVHTEGPVVVALQAGLAISEHGTHHRTGEELFSHPGNGEITTGDIFKIIGLGVGEAQVQSGQLPGELEAGNNIYRLSVLG